MVKKQAGSSTGAATGVMAPLRKPPAAQAATAPSANSTTAREAPTRTRLAGPASDTPHARHTAIAEAAYLLAHQRGFEPGHELEDWLAAEADYAARSRS